MDGRLDVLLRELCNEAGLDPSDPAAGSGVLVIDDMPVSVGMSEDGISVDVRIVLASAYEPRNDESLLRQLAYHACDVQGDDLPIRFGLVPETGRPVAMVLAPLTDLQTGSDLLRLLEMLCELAQDEFAGLCAMALAEFASEALDHDETAAGAAGIAPRAGAVNL